MKKKKYAIATISIVYYLFFSSIVWVSDLKFTWTYWAASFCFICTVTIFNFIDRVTYQLCFLLFFSIIGIVFFRSFAFLELPMLIMIFSLQFAYSDKKVKNNEGRYRLVTVEICLMISALIYYIAKISSGHYGSFSYSLNQPTRTFFVHSIPMSSFYLLLFVIIQKKVKIIKKEKKKYLKTVYLLCAIITLFTYPVMCISEGGISIAYFPHFVFIGELAYNNDEALMYIKDWVVKKVGELQ